ncbi:hypothetical protein [Oryza sativa Japonica Group]|uniref:Uncharacterized protein n=1 Tax=Oryza sativa subsp. japonica TaxID=39947 RepID=Q5N7F8_ORYSJ|nr:hypothetical protein [Oryza sativa Japonica Group]BAD82598.1 hypothetical protein [Oryza sativa Japonica Group]
MAYISRSFPHPYGDFKNPKATHTGTKTRSQRRGKSNRIAQRRRRATGCSLQRERSQVRGSRGLVGERGDAPSRCPTAGERGVAGFGGDPAVERRRRRRRSRSTPIVANVGGESRDAKTSAMDFVRLGVSVGFLLLLLLLFSFENRFRRGAVACRRCGDWALEYWRLKFCEGDLLL